MSSGSIRIIQLPEKSSVNTDDYMAVDSSANGTKKVKFTDLLDDNLSAQNKAADAQATGQAISELNTDINNTNTRIDNMINTQQNAEVTTLWTGTLNTIGGSVTLSKSVSNFDFLDFYTSNGTFERVPVSAGTLKICETNIDDNGLSAFQQTGEATITFSGTTVTLTSAYIWDYASTGTVTISSGIVSNIKRIDGVKIGHIENDEIVDARVGANGTTYPTLGDAIRGQVTDLKADLKNQIEFIGGKPSELIGNAVAFDAVVDSDIKLIPDDETTIYHYGRNMWENPEMNGYSYAWSQITTLSGLITAGHNKALLKANKEYVFQSKRPAGTNTWRFGVKAFDLDGDLITDNSKVNFHAGTKSTITSYNGTIHAFIPAAASAYEVAYFAPTQDCYINIINEETAAKGEYSMLELSNSLSPSEYEAYKVYQNNLTIDSPTIIKAGAYNTILSFGSTVNVEYVGIIDIGLSLANQNDTNNRIYLGDYTDCFKLSNPINLASPSIGDVIDVSPLNVVGTHYTILLNDINGNEQFTINVADGSNSRPWAFLDADYKLLSRAYDAYAQNVVIKAPLDAKYLIIQCGSAYYSTAYIIRQASLNYLSFGKRLGVNELNDITEMTEKLENASNVAKGDASTAVKSRTNLLNLIHLSDIHGNTANIARVLDFADVFADYIHDILHTGDAPQTYFGNDNPFATIGGDRILEVVGNHECWIQGDTWPSPYNATAQQVYQKYFDPFIASWNVQSAGANLCYYYKDYTDAKIRLIVLDALHYDSAQESWFANVLADAITSNKRVVAVTHYPSQTGISGIDCTFNCITRTIDAVETPPAGTQIERMPESAFTAVDTFINNGGEFVCWLSGHTHEDFIGTVNNHTDQIQIIISCANTSNQFSDCARTEATKTQDLFNVFTVDGTAKLIKLIRVGATMDKFMRKRETLCINYETKEAISNN